MSNVPCNAVACFAHKDGYCICLKDNDFGNKRCPFFKTKSQYKKQVKKCEERLQNLGRG